MFAVRTSAEACPAWDLYKHMRPRPFGRTRRPRRQGASTRDRSGRNHQLRRSLAIVRSSGALRDPSVLAGQPDGRARTARFLEGRPAWLTAEERRRAREWAREEW